MQPLSTTLALTLLSLASSTPIHHSPQTGARMLYMGQFNVHATPHCPLGEGKQFFLIGLGADAPVCHNFYSNTTMGAIDVDYWSPHCQLTLHTTLDCSDDGVVSGVGCWSPEGGIKGYKHTCPWKTWP